MADGVMNLRVSAAGGCQGGGEGWPVTGWPDGAAVRAGELPLGPRLRTLLIMVVSPAHNPLPGSAQQSR